MTLVRILVVAAISTAALSSGASAAVLSYSYQGQTLTLAPEDVDAAEAEGLPSEWPAYFGMMVIDEAALPGGTLVNANVTFSEMYPGEPDQTAGLVSFNIFPFPAVAGSIIRFTTDSEKRIVSWNSDFLDGPPDGGITDTGDYFYIPSGMGFIYSAPPGEWSAPTLIPLPATAPLALLAFGGLVALRSRR